VASIANDAYYDITPYTTSGTLVNAATTGSAGSALVTMAHTSHGRIAGDFIVISGGPYTWDGVTLANGTYTIVSITSVNAYVITASSGTATAGATAIVASITYGYPLTAGYEYATNAYGWGTGAWGSSTWGTARAAGLLYSPAVWSADQWGEDVIAARAPSSNIFYYDTSAGLSSNRMTKVQTVDATTLIANGVYPKATKLLVTPERQLVLFGCEATLGSGTIDPLLIRWSDYENYQVLDTLDTNSAGDFRLQAGNEIMSVKKTRNGILILTDYSAHIMQAAQYPYVFGFQQLGTNCGAIGQNAAIDYNGVVYWMGSNRKFYKFDGQLQAIECPIQDTIFDDINFNQNKLVSCGVNAEWEEIWWFYCSEGQVEPNKYVVYCWQDGTFYSGTLERTFWTDRSTFTYPIATDNDGILYYHESGVDNNGAAMDSYAETGEFQLAEGDSMIFADKIMPDIHFHDEATDTVYFTIKTKYYPNSSEEFTKGPYAFTSGDTKIDVRARGRQFALKVASNEVGGDFHLGPIRVNIQPDGGR
jgi:hypothetical protein